MKETPMSILDSAKQLFELGFAIHWIRPRSKIPVKSGWTSGPRDDWATLKKEYKKGYNVGVRLGKASKINGLYLGVIDCDVKSKDPKHCAEMLGVVETLLSGEEPQVLSGRGNGSRHFYVLSKEPLAPRRITQSPDIVKVSMPSEEPRRKELESLSKKEIKEGVRLRAAWEVCIMGEGQQVVLPPSVHPDSGKPYVWKVDVAALDTTPTFKAPLGEAIEKNQRQVLNDFKAVEVDLISSTLPERVIDQIINGANVEDRSAALFGVAAQMVRHGFKENEILSVLTDDTNYLGVAAFDHAKTKSRLKAAEWVKRYTLDKARASVAAANDFKEIAVIEDTKSLEEMEKLADESAGGEWKNKIERNLQTKKPLNTMQNLILIIKNCVEEGDFLGRDEFNHADIWLKVTPWGSRVGSPVVNGDLILVKEYLGKKFRLESSIEKILEVLTFLAMKNRFHPVREYLSGLEWDGVERLDSWLKDYLGAVGDKKYLKAVGRKTLVAMVKRIYEPGCKFDHVLILEGEQGIGKSTTARILSDPWFSDSLINIGDKDAVMNMQGVWVYELGELSAMSRYDVNLLKEFITRQTDKIRPPYGRLSEIFPRQCIFIGTTNNDEYLKDQTGNRRFWPVKVGRLKRRDLIRDREQLLAEAFEHYQFGEELWLDDMNVETIARQEQKRRVETDAIDEMLSDFFDKETHENFNPDNFRVSDVLNSFDGKGLRNDRQTQMRIGAALKRLGFEKTRKMVGGINASWWAKKSAKNEVKKDDIF